MLAFVTDHGPDLELEAANLRMFSLASFVAESA